MKATLFAAFLACAALNAAAQAPAAHEVKRGYGGAYDKKYDYGHYKDDDYEPEDQYDSHGHYKRAITANKGQDAYANAGYADEDDYEDCPPESSSYYDTKPTPSYHSPPPSTYPTTYYKPSTTPPPAPYAKPATTMVTVYTTMIETICPSGLSSKEYTITETWTDAKPYTKPDIPQGWVETVTVCSVCSDKPMTVTLKVQPAETYNNTIAKPASSMPATAPLAPLSPATTMMSAPSEYRVAPSAAYTAKPKANTTNVSPAQFTGGAMAAVDSVGRTYGGIVLAAMMAGIWFL